MMEGINDDDNDCSSSSSSSSKGSMQVGSVGYAI